MTTYRIEIDALGSAGHWQTLHTENHTTDHDPADLAEEIAANQNVAEGSNWRVRIYSTDVPQEFITECGPDSWEPFSGDPMSTNDIRNLYVLSRDVGNSGTVHDMATALNRYGYARYNVVSQCEVWTRKGIDLLLSI